MVMIPATKKRCLRFEGDKEEVVWEVLNWAGAGDAWSDYDLNINLFGQVLAQTFADVRERVSDNNVPGQSHIHIVIRVEDENSFRNEIRDAVLTLVNERTGQPMVRQSLFTSEH